MAQKSTLKMLSSEIQIRDYAVLVSLGIESDCLCAPRVVRRTRSRQAEW